MLEPLKAFLSLWLQHCRQLRSWNSCEPETSHWSLCEIAVWWDIRERFRHALLIESVINNTVRLSIVILE